jgi:hypothetical protein
MIVQNSNTTCANDCRPGERRGEVHDVSATSVLALVYLIVFGSQLAFSA